jgi:Ca2+-binding EF-hand superfamily protein
MPAATMTGLRGKVYEKLSQKAVWEQSHNIFEQLDEDGSGFLDVAELQQGMERFGAKLSEKQVREMCAKIGGGDEGLNRQQLMTFLTMLLGIKDLATPKAGCEFRGTTVDAALRCSLC